MDKSFFSLILCVFSFSVVNAAELDIKRELKKAQSFENDAKESLACFSKLCEKEESPCLCNLTAAIECFITASEIYWMIYQSNKEIEELRKCRKNYDDAVKYWNDLINKYDKGRGFKLEACLVVRATNLYNKLSKHS